MLMWERATKLLPHHDMLVPAYLDSLPVAPPLPTSQHDLSVSPRRSLRISSCQERLARVFPGGGESVGLHPRSNSPTRPSRQEIRTVGSDVSDSEP